MKRRRFLRIYATRAALTLFLLFLIVYTVYHALRNTAGGVLTTPARTISDTAVTAGEAFLFRDETVLTVPEAGLIDPLAADGAKVGRNTALVRVWPVPEGGDREELQWELDALDRTIRVLEASLSDETLSLSAAGPNRAAAREDLLAVCRAVRSGDFGAIPALEEKILTGASRYARLTGSEDDLRAALDEARAGRDSLLTGTPVTVSDAGRSGYFYGRASVDGLETVFPTSALEALTPAALAELASAEPVSPDGFAVGKLAASYRWYLAVLIGPDAQTGISRGDVCTVSLPASGGLTLTFTCVRTASDATGTVVILSSEDIPGGLVWLRRQRVELRLETVTGYYVPEQALVTLPDGQTGVYVLEGSTVLWRRIDVIRAGSGYRIAGRTDPDPDNPVPYLADNDLIILSGKNLYNGKVYN